MITKPTAEHKNTTSRILLKNVPRGETFKRCRHEWIVLDHDKTSRTLALSKNVIDDKILWDKRQPSNIWSKSQIREYLNNEFLNKLCKNKSAQQLGFREFATDLTSIGGLKDYEESIDIVSLLTYDSYRKHRDVIKTDENWWLLATPCGFEIPNFYQDGPWLVVTPYDGCVLSTNLCPTQSVGGMRPVCCFDSHIRVQYMH